MNPRIHCKEKYETLPEREKTEEIQKKKYFIWNSTELRRFWEKVERNGQKEVKMSRKRMTCYEK